MLEMQDITFLLLEKLRADLKKITSTGPMCIPTILKWENPKEGITINGNKMLLEDSTCKCIIGGGDISIHFDLASANQIAVWGGAKMPTEYIKDGFDWAFSFADENRALRDAMLPEWAQGVAHVSDWFGDLTIGLVEGAVTGVVGLGEVIYQVAQDPVGMAESVGGMIVDADKWLREKEMQAIVWASKGENWTNAADTLWKTTTETDWTQVAKEGVETSWKNTKKAANWVADNPRKIGTTVGEFIPDVVVAVYSGGTSLAATASKKAIKEVGEEIVEKAVKETVEEVAEAGGKKALKEGVGAIAKKEADDIAKVVTKNSDDILTKQKKLIDDVENSKIELEGYDGHKKGNHTRKSNYGEMKMDQYMKDLGYEPLHKQIDNIDQSITKGIDGVYKHPGPPPKYAIGEAKYDTSKLGKAKDGPQMSDEWIEGSKRLEKAVGKKQAREIMTQGYDKVLVHSDKAGKVTAKTVETSTKINKAGKTVKVTKPGVNWP